MKKVNRKYILWFMGSFNFLFLIANDVISQNAVEQYDINDPRNPNCPCHKYQKQADEEFAKLNKSKDKTNEINSDFNLNIPEIVLPKVNSVEIESSSAKIDEGIKFHLKKAPPIAYAGGKSKSNSKNIWVKKNIFRMRNKFKRIKKVKTNYNVCFEW